MHAPAADPLAPLSADRAARLVIDVQERFAGSIAGWRTLLERVAALCEGARALGLPVAATEQYVKGLGRTVDPVRQAVGPDAPVIEKMRFSAMTPEIRDWFDRTGRSQLILCGIEAHVCVLQTALDARRAGISTWLASDAISAGQPDQIPPAMHRMQQAGCVTTGVISCLYEMAGSADHPAFKPVLNAAKRALSAH
ncbi:MAG: isochorismatase family protein [Phycisphaerales bacterium]|nr:isochorismatase family protein [Phycisphaerales bacterium]